MDIQRIFYKLARKEQQFREKLQKQIDDSFDDLQFPGLRQIIPTTKEGGCYVTFATRDQAKQVLQELEGVVAIAGHQKKAFVVQGKPFIEDLTHRLPSPKIVVEIVEPQKTQQRLTQELIYSEFRTYGRIQDIILDPRREFASITYTSSSAAIAARNCLHFKTIGDSKLSIRYEPFSVLFLASFTFRDYKLFGIP
jgi:RNA recognition motif-containing protein